MTGASLVLVCITYGLNLWLIPLYSRITPSDAAFLEGVIFIIVGALFFLGSGGLSRTSQQAAMLTATAGAVFGEGAIGPSEIFRRDAWKPRGYAFFGLALIVAGVGLIIIYFISL